MQAPSTPTQPAQGTKDLGLSDGTHVQVLAGAPTPEELTAVVVALEQVARATASRHERRPAWVRAARREAVGGASVAFPAQLR